MIASLEEAADADATEKAYCDKELAETRAKKEDKTAEIKKLSTKIDQMSTRSAKLKEEVAALQKALADLMSAQAEKVTVPEDRSWTKDLTGGVPMDNNADPVLCRDVRCVPADCPEFDQFFDGRCCTKCKTAAAVTPADLAKGFKEG